MIALLLAVVATVDPYPLDRSGSAPIAIQNVRVEVGNGTVRDRATIVITHGVITSLDGPIPAKAQVIDGAGRTLSPGFIAARTELGAVEVELEPSGNDTQLQPPPSFGGGSALPSPLVPGFSMAWGFNPASVWIPVVRSQGVTGAVVAPTGGVLAGSGAWVHLTGAINDRPDPSVPAAIFGGIDADAVAHGGGARGAVWLALRQALEDARFYRQNKALFDKGNSRPLSLAPIHLAALFPVIDGQLPLVLQADRASDIFDALELAQLEHLKLVISGGAEAWKVAGPLASQQVPVIIEPSKQEPASLDSAASRDDLAALLDKAGVPVIINASGFPSSSQRLRQEAGIAVSTGMPHAAAIQSISLNVAKAYGRSHEVGSVEVGKRADLVLWSGDPLELSSVAERVWIAGEEQPSGNRQRELFERYRNLPQ